MDASVLQAVQYAEPVFTALILTDFDREDLFHPGVIDTEYNISQFADDAIPNNRES